MKKLLLLFVIVFISIDIFAADSTQNYYFVFLRSNPDKAVLPDSAVEALQAAHMQNIEALYKAGKLVAAGPFDGGGGIFILKSESLEKSSMDMKSDPAIKAGRFIVDIHPMEIYKGEICPVGDDYKMVTYKFIEFSPGDIIGESCLDEFKTLLKNFSDQDSTIASFFLTDTRGGILIHTAGNFDEVKRKLDKDVCIANKNFSYIIKDLWIAKETFCE